MIGTADSFLMKNFYQQPTWNNQLLPETTENQTKCVKPLFPLEGWRWGGIVTSEGGDSGGEPRDSLWLTEGLQPPSYGEVSLGGDALEVQAGPKGREYAGHISERGELPKWLQLSTEDFPQVSSTVHQCVWKRHHLWPEKESPKSSGERRPLIRRN